jgi:Phytanoyl-CoA dioxygenase (PhyH)
MHTMSNSNWRIALWFVIFASVDAFVPPQNAERFDFARSVSQLERVQEGLRLDVPQDTVTSTATQAAASKKRVLDEPALWEYNFGLQDPKLPLPHGIVQDVSPPERFAITQEQLKTLERDGVVHVSSVFDADWVEYLRTATAYQVDNPHFWAFAGTASKLYDYIQRNVWQTNRAFTNFYYHSALGHVLAQCGSTEEVRISTDLLMVNPNKGFKWHQDNQNGPITPDDGIRFWITMDETPATYGAPVYLKGSHRNNVVDENAVFVDVYETKLIDQYEAIEFQPKPGDMIIWHPRTIHKIDGPADGIWTSYRRVLGGTAAKGGTKYVDKRGTGGVLSDLGRHDMQHGDPLSSSYFPLIYPRFKQDEAAARDAGRVGRSFSDIITKVGGMVSATSTQKFRSFFDVLGSQSSSTSRS